MFAENLKNLRKQHELTQNELAEKLYVSIQSISRWETGESEPSFDVLLKISEIFNVTTDRLLGKELIPDDELHWQIYRSMINKTDGDWSFAPKYAMEICRAILPGMFPPTFKDETPEQSYSTPKKYDTYADFATSNGIALFSDKDESPKIFALLDYSEKNLNKYLYPDKKFTDYFSILADERIFKTVLKVHTLPYNMGYDKAALLECLELNEADFDEISDSLTKLVIRISRVSINEKDTVLYFPVYNHYTIMVIAIVRLIQFSHSNAGVYGCCEPIL